MGAGELLFPAGFIAHLVLRTFENTTSCNQSSSPFGSVVSRMHFPSEEELEYLEATREVSSILVLIKDDNKSSKKYLSTPREEISYVHTKNIFL